MNAQTLIAKARTNRINALRAIQDKRDNLFREADLPKPRPVLIFAAPAFARAA